MMNKLKYEKWKKVKHLTCCDNIKEYCNEKSLKNFDNIYNMLLKIIEMIENERCVIKESLEYPDIKDFNFILNLALKNGDYLSKIDKYFNSFYQNRETIIDYLKDDYIILINE